MEEESKTHQSPAETYAKPVPNSDSGDDPSPPTTANDGEELKTKDPDTVRESKRRKSCPIALDECEATFKTCSNSSFSFTFDPKFCSGATTPEVTPKFGSFNLVTAASAAEIKEKIEEQKGAEEEEEEQQKDEVPEKRKIVESLGSVDGIKSSD